ncbi:MAG TPA: DnaJ domain-containing protein [Polyangiaceae bacterium]|nr:DnaJ domain-containing protein [Polyangiaceae bacterium]
MNAPKASATGNLAKTPVPELLVYALDRSLEGTLVLEETDGKKSAIYFQNGAPAKAKTADAVAYLGQVLVEQGSITQELYQSTLAKVSSTRQLFGEVLLAEKAIRNQDLLEALREQVIQKVSHLFKLPGSTVFGFYSGSDFLARWGGPPTRVKPLPLLWRGLRLFTDESKVEALIQRIGERQLKLYMDAPIGRFKLTPQERGVVDLIRGRPTTLSVLFKSGLGHEGLVKRVIYALAVTRQLDFGVPGVEPVGLEEAPSSTRLPVYDPEASGGRVSRPSFSHRSIVPSQGGLHSRLSSDPPPSAPVPLSPEHEALKAEIERRAAADDDYYQVLGVPKDAPSSAIQAVFFQLAKVWHPDRLPPELAHVRDLDTKVFARMSEAHQILTDAVRRKEYDQLLAQGGGSAEEQEQITKVVRAATAFQRAEVLLKKRDLAGAEREALEAMHGDPEQAEYKALYAWVCAQSPRESYDDLVNLLDEALKAEPTNQRALWYRGQLHVRLGNPNRAIRDFKTLLEVNPKHLDAQREVRLHEMRRAGSKEEKGLLGKWFKR